MNKIFNSVIAVGGVWLFLVFFSSQLPEDQSQNSKTITVNIRELEEKPTQQPKPQAQPEGFTQAQLSAQGQAYLSSGGSAAAGELPRINGSGEERDFLEFSRVSKAKLLVYSAGLKRYLGELNTSGPVPVLVPLDVERLKADYPADGRVVKTPGLVGMASEAAARKGSGGPVKLYMVLPNQQNLYLLGKLVTTLRGEGLEMKDVASVAARYMVSGGNAQIVFVSALLKNGKSIQLKEMEATV